MPSFQLVRLAHLGLRKFWHNYQDLVNGRDKLPDWGRFWFDLLQGEIRRNTRYVVTSIADEEEVYALVGKGKKAKGMKVQGEAKSSKDNGKKKDLSKITAMNMATMQPSVQHKKSNKEPTTK